jgi:hypothetical protein
MSRIVTVNPETIDRNTGITVTADGKSQRLTRRRSTPATLAAYDSGMIVNS